MKSAKRVRREVGAFDYAAVAIGALWLGVSIVGATRESAGTLYHKTVASYGARPWTRLLSWIDTEAGAAAEPASEKKEGKWAPVNLTGHQSARLASARGTDCSSEARRSGCSSGSLR
jgi:hypothetical protein